MPAFLVQLAPSAPSVPPRKPSWLKVPAPGGPNYVALKQLMRELKLHTVCEEAHCPNVGECWEHRAATFMILGDVCTRNCAYCAVAHGTPRPLELPRRTTEVDSRLITTSWTSCGLGEEWHELLAAMRDLRTQRVDLLTLGQYLRPSDRHLPIARSYTPDVFAELKRLRSET